MTAAKALERPSCSLPSMIARHTNTFAGPKHSLLETGFVLSDRNSSRMVVGGAMGEMLVPSLIAALLGPDDGGWPAALYSVCVATSALLVVVYGACCRQLKADGRYVG